MNTYRTMTPTDLKAKLVEGNSARLIDVRDFDEFERLHVQGADCVPLQQILRGASEWSRDDDLTLICHSGQRAKEAAEKLESVGFNKVAAVEGGTKACVSAGLPLVRGSRRLPIQRQVLIGAGVVLLSGLALSFVQASFIAITWFAASMLVIAGLTGFCPMAKVLAAAPWNRKATPSCGSGSCNVATVGDAS
jgi:rhodanese-related sulfurtransferase